MKFTIISCCFIFSIIWSQNKVLSQKSPHLNPKGAWMLNEIKEKFTCDEKVTLSAQGENLVIDMSSCDKMEIYNDKLRPYVYNLYWHGIDNHNEFTSIAVPAGKLSWKADQMDFAYVQPEKISIFGRDFILLNDSTYRVERHGQVIVPEFKTRYFNNCVYKTDTLNAIAMIQQWGNRWQISVPCSPYYMEKTNTKMWGDDDKWTYYSLPCTRNGVTKLRTISLSNDGQFRWAWGLGNGMESVTAGTYTVQGDTLLVIQTDIEMADAFTEEYKKLFPGTTVTPKYLIQRQYLIREDRIYFVNEYR